MAISDPDEFDPIPVIEMLRTAAHHYHHLPEFKVGDLVEFHDPGNARETGQVSMPMVVLELFKDLEPINKDPGFRGVPGLRVMMQDAEVPWMDTEVRIFPAWHLQPYTGKRPHQQ